MIGTIEKDWVWFLLGVTQRRKINLFLYFILLYMMLSVFETCVYRSVQRSTEVAANLLRHALQGLVVTLWVIDCRMSRPVGVQSVLESIDARCRYN